MEPRYIDQTQVQEMIVGISASAIRRLRKQDKFVKPFKFGGKLFWLEHEVKAWMEQQRIDAATEKDAIDSA